MTDQLHGWLTCEPLYTTPPTNPRLYRTTNGGRSWNPINWNEDFDDVYKTPSALVATSRTGSGILSTDGGITFGKAVDSTNGLNFVDGLHGVMTGYEEKFWHHTTDGGRMWLLKLQFRIMLSDSSWTDFRIASIELNNNDFNFGKCALGAISDSATIGLQFVCGDSLLYTFLRFGSKWSPGDGIVSTDGGAGSSTMPDPVMSGSSLTIPYTALRPATSIVDDAVKLEIMDSKGAVVFSDIQNTTTAGASEFLIPNLPLASGAYQYRLQTTDGGRGAASGSFVVVK